MSIAFELKHMAIGRPAPANPNVSVFVCINSVFGLGPIKSFAGPAPGMEQMSLFVELEDRWCGDAAHGTRRCERGANFIGGIRGGSLQDPDMVFAIYGEATDLAED